MTTRTTIRCRSTTEAAELIRTGRLVAFPTETVYGLGADATNPDAVAGIFESKGRPTFDPLIVHVADVLSAQELVTSFSETAVQLAAAFWPGPMTLVLPRREIIPDLVTAGLPGVGIRIPDHPLALELLQLAECPIAAPSANPFGGISPTTAQHVLDGLQNRIDGILDGGSCGVGIESTVVSLMTDHPTVLRLGGLPVEAIEDVIGPVEIAVGDPTKDDSAQPAPGMLSRHYAPGTPMQLLQPEQTAVAPQGRRCGLLTYRRFAQDGPAFAPEVSGFEVVEVTGDDSNLRACAANFFQSLRKLDAKQLDLIYAHLYPPHGLGRALNDRLRRAIG